MRRKASVMVRVFDGRYRFKKPKKARVDVMTEATKFELRSTKDDDYGLQATQYALDGMAHEITIDESRVSPRVAELARGKIVLPL